MFLYALLEKEGVMSLLSVTGGPDLFQVRNWSGRDGSTFYGGVRSSIAAANYDFREAVAQSVERGWAVRYYGPPRFG